MKELFFIRFFLVGSSEDGNMGTVIPPDDMPYNQCTVLVHEA
jgi:hypothetical protein